MQHKTSLTVLIGFADSLSAPEVAWSLVDSGFNVVAFARYGTSPALRTSRLVRVEYVTDPRRAVQATIADLKTLIVQLGHPLVMALDDESLWVIQQVAKSQIVKAVSPIGPPATAALDKRLQLAAAARAGFRVPQTRQFQSALELKTLTSFPAIVKPALAVLESRGRLSRGRTSAVSDASELARLVTHWRTTEPYLAQPLLEGHCEGVFGLVVGDRVVCWSGHRRVRMMNPAGSGASACISMKPDHQVLAVAERFLQSIDWRGMFMIELLRDQQGRLWFMELNGRPWGSMALARRMGFEYPAWAVRNMLEPTYSPPPPQEVSPVLCRNLGRELLHLIFVWRGPNSNAYNHWPGRMATLREVLRVRQNDHWYNRNSKDKSVFWADTVETVSSQLIAFAKRHIPRFTGRVANRLRRPAMRHQQARIRASGRLRDRLNAHGQILFVCYGNINRSAVAEQHLRKILGSAGQISSSGFHKTGGRPLDPTMLALAAKAGIHFTTWSSRTINHEMVAQADLILCMETAHLIRLLSEYPEADGRAFLLSCFTPPDSIPLEIEDPYGKSDEAYFRCIRDVTFATALIAESLRERLANERWNMDSTMIAPLTPTTHVTIEPLPVSAPQSQHG